jgi:hypothetical protein
MTAGLAKSTEMAKSYDKVMRDCRKLVVYRRLVRVTGAQLYKTKKKKRLKVQKIDFIATGLPIMPSLPQQNGTPPAKSGAQKEIPFL